MADIKFKAGRASELVGKKNLAPVGNQTLGRPARSVPNIPTPSSHMSDRKKLREI
jgi:hypothetical protein